MFSGVARTPGKCVANEKELHVVKGKGWQPRKGFEFWESESGLAYQAPVVHVVLAPLGVGS